MLLALFLTIQPGKSPITVNYFSQSLFNSIIYKGVMITFGIVNSQVLPYFTHLDSLFGNCEVVVACINSPNNLTLSGREDQILTLMTLMEEAGIFNCRLQVNVVYHSPQMEAIASEHGHLIEFLDKGILPTKPCVISSLKARPIGIDEISDIRY